MENCSIHTVIRSRQVRKKATVPNYYTGEDIEIPLDDQLTPMENAKKYFDRYGKLKRTYEALTEYVQETGEEVEHLRSVVNALDLAQDEADLSQIREELVQSGYIRHKGNKKERKDRFKTAAFYQQ